MIEEEEYGTMAWFQKYEPEAVEVVYPAGYAAGYAACKADVTGLLYRVAEMSVKQVARVLYMLIGRIDRDDFVPTQPEPETACQETKP